MIGYLALSGVVLTRYIFIFLFMNSNFVNRGSRENLPIGN